MEAIESPIRVDIDNPEIKSIESIEGEVKAIMEAEGVDCMSEKEVLEYFLPSKREYVRKELTTPRILDRLQNIDDIYYFRAKRP